MVLDPSSIGPNNGSMRRALAAALVCAAAVAFPNAVATGSASTKPLTQRLAKRWRASCARGPFAAMALDLNTGAVVFGRNPGLSLVPASNEKLPITYTALETLGADYGSPPTCSGKARWSGPPGGGRSPCKDTATQPSAPQA